MAESKPLYITLISVHGLIRGENMELGRDADTGGQVLYVVELARALAAHPNVARVDLLTRRIHDPKVGPDYAKPEERLSDKAHLIRLDCGPRRYLRKEVLWPHLQEFIDRALQHVRSVGEVPDVIHSHYADAGLVGARLAGLLGVPLIHTGHSLGLEKQKQMRAKGIRQAALEEQYNISTRIEAEEIVLGTADIVVASTRQEVEEQYAEYDNYHPKRMQVIPPGVDLSRFHPPGLYDTNSAFARDIARFLHKPLKPMILALSRADERKNIASLVRAYGESSSLQEKANLVVVAGNRDEIRGMDKGPRDVLTEILFLMDKYDLYGKFAFPKHHTGDDVPDMYRLAARRHGVFINPALTEPFGLTLIEAAASGLPLVATNDGGPKEILHYCANGLLLDPHNIKDIQRKLLDALSDNRRWKRWSRSGVDGANRHYSWPGHAQRYLELIESLLRSTRRRKLRVPSTKTRLPTVDRLAITSLDNALFGDDQALRQLQGQLRKHGRHIGYGIATGRSLDSALRLMKRKALPIPDILITSVGTCIHYCHNGQRIVEDTYWANHIDYRWEPRKLSKIMRRVPGAKPRADNEQTRYKLSYDIDPEVTPSAREIKRLLRMNDLHAKIVISETRILDLLPIRASKGLAIRYLSIKWGVPLEHILVVGDSGNDEEMLLGDTLGVVVGNHSAELSKLRGKPRIYFAEGKYASGIMEGFAHYQFFSTIQIPSV
ncbi:MAG: HAD-IIB family hydrolase [Gammaproteobacteria bacterium]|nr:HAD-IIB family hydrolase [Gammaproteobacteria bacterium]